MPDAKVAKFIEGIKDAIGFKMIFFAVITSVFGAADGILFSGIMVVKHVERRSKEQRKAKK